MLAHSDEEERLTRTKSELENGIAIALGGLAAEEMCLGESGTGPGADLAHATQLAAQMVGSFGMAGSLISYEAVADGPLSRSNLVGKILANTETKQKVEDILEAQRAAGRGHPGREPRHPRRAGRRAPRSRRAGARRHPRGHREGDREPALRVVPRIGPAGRRLAAMTAFLPRRRACGRRSAGSTAGWRAMRAVDLGAVAIACRPRTRPGSPPTQVEYTIMGHVLQAGTGSDHGPPGGRRRRHPDRRPGDHDQQGLSRRASRRSPWPIR